MVVPLHAVHLTRACEGFPRGQNECKRKVKRTNDLSSTNVDDPVRLFIGLFRLETRLNFPLMFGSVHHKANKEVRFEFWNPSSIEERGEVGSSSETGNILEVLSAHHRYYRVQESLGMREYPSW